MHRGKCGKIPGGDSGKEHSHSEMKKKHSKMNNSRRVKMLLPFWGFSNEYMGL